MLEGKEKAGKIQRVERPSPQEGKKEQLLCYVHTSLSLESGALVMEQVGLVMNPLYTLPLTSPHRK
jgi:hypothetical protein